MYFKELFNHFMSIKKNDIRVSTLDLYKRMYHLHFHILDNKVVEDFSCKTIDDWLLTLKDRNTNRQRFSFDNELTLMKNIINHYNEFFEGDLRIFKKKHLKLSKVKPKQPKEDKSFNEKEFKEFLDCIGALYGEKFYMLALIQYYEALRISEAYALHYSDFHMTDSPFTSYIEVRRSVVFTHNSKKRSYIQECLKNRTSKELPILPEVWGFLKSHLEKYKNKYLFMPNGKPEEYHTLQRAYNTAFRSANLPYSSTHILRHGGASRIFNITGGNIICTSELLGNTQEETIKTYAHPYRDTLRSELERIYLR